MNPISKTPFLLLLLPLVVGIALQYYFQINTWSITFYLVGGIAMLFSFLAPTRFEYGTRWLFGAGISVFLIGFSIFLTSKQQEQAKFIFEDEWNTYEAIVETLPKEKPHSLAYEIYLPRFDKKLIAYLETDSLKEGFNLGDRILFQGKIARIENKRNATFDYARYMSDKGFAGSVYISSSNWKKVGERFSLKTYALHLRSQIINYYKSIGLNDVEVSILSALTLGDKGAVPDDIIQAFRNTGTVHVLSVSGLHVGLIYAFILSLLSFIRKRSKLFWVKYLLIIILLWFYALLTGLSPSVIRACTMLTIYCIGQLLSRKSSAIHALYISAFFILVVSPLSLFDIGFQLSFSAVFTILLVFPYLRKVVKTNNRILKYIWNTFAISLVAQLGTFPLCLYYFGTFPTYFFVANLCVIPIIILLIYSSPLILISILLSFVSRYLSGVLMLLLTKFIAYLTKGLVSTLHLFESLPFSCLTGIYFSFLELVLLLLFLTTSFYYLIKNSKSAMVVALVSILLLLLNAFLCIL